MPEIIETNRLQLHLIETLELVTLFEEPENLAIYSGKAFNNPYRVLMDNSGPLKWRVPQVKINPELNIWFVRWIVLKETNEIIGSISFHAAPDDNGMIEIGYEIAEEFRNRGYGSEALKGMWEWVIDQPGVRTLRYTVSAENLASVAVINKFGFEHVGQQIDEEDGPEEIYEMSAEIFKTI